MLNKRNVIICRCEEVTLHTLQVTVSTYQCSSRELKLRTRAGMGYCGGRTCRQLIDAIASEISSTVPGNAPPLGYQPPVRPVSFDLLGGTK
ncbi:pyridine nucleotide-disulfide oxidoreductase [Brevibacillus reuszeri]|uniref:Pyridine nucleotide-disulfide oxidoreductase n=1 Tax=Brevibacillus reuszeri TaxID=54915 RepID=A0A0K9YKS8_9BACL|nr:(2Fe-2S)-binding protein [Brevibacillus reuszeri]KNB69267.1 pyridine nucleotide-disulfide oxidoreductase [Brevibacillus reuszeri]MED1860213.1 (2Fe-2S)-binding protein [Brevibacillus reuszeri]GED71588.1 pyridine nucleotide-disulfide oxidoreductase [Brevibacillus reuszeri]